MASKLRLVYNTVSERVYIVLDDRATAEILLSFKYTDGRYYNEHVETGIRLARGIAEREGIEDAVYIRVKADGSEVRYGLFDEALIRECFSSAEGRGNE